MAKRILKATVLFFILCLATVQPALAYIDPNTGGMLFQLLAALFATFSAIFLIFSRQLRSIFARIRRSVRQRLGRAQAAEADSTASGDPAPQPKTPPE